MYQSEKVQSMVDELSQINPFYGREGLAEPPRPDEKSIPRDIPANEQIPHIQKQLDLLSYNHLPHTFFNLDKHRSLQSILMTGKETLTEALPIRCLEATFAAMYMTQENKDIDRIPLSFRSSVNGQHYQHIVLVVHLKQPSSLYGALGLSRKRTLMYKPLGYRNLYELVMDYKHEYEVLGHELVDIKLGLAITHDPHSRLVPCWRFVALKLSAFNEPPSLPGVGRRSPANTGSPGRSGATPASNAPPQRPPSRSSAASSFRLVTSPTTPGILSVSGGSPALSTAAPSLQRPVMPAEPIRESLPAALPPPVADEGLRSSPCPPGTCSPHVSPMLIKIPETSASDRRLSWPSLGSPVPAAGIITPSSPHKSTGTLEASLAPADAGAAAPVATATPAPVIARPTSGAAARPPSSPTLTASPPGSRAALREEMSPLAQFLGKYSRLLPVMTEQYYKGLPVVDNTNRNAKLCFMSLEEAERDAKMENTRRIEMISKLLSPLSLEARKVAANRQLKSEGGKKKRSRSRPRQGEKGATPSTVTNGSAGAAGKSFAKKRTGLRTGARSARQVAAAGAVVPVTVTPNAVVPSDDAGRLLMAAFTETPPLCLGSLPPTETPPTTARPSEVVIRAEAPCDVRSLADGAFGMEWQSVAARSTSAGRSSRGMPSLPPTPRNDSVDLSPPTPLSGASSSCGSSRSSSSSDDGFLMDRSNTEGGS